MYVCMAALKKTFLTQSCWVFFFIRRVHGFFPFFVVFFATKNKHRPSNKTKQKMKSYTFACIFLKSTYGTCSCVINREPFSGLLSKENLNVLFKSP
jgi:magnesium-transporting ATPase (P-type)